MNKLVLFVDAEGLVRWHLVTRNGRIILGCTQGYHDKLTMIKSLLMVKFVQNFNIVDKDDLFKQGYLKHLKSILVI